MARIKGVPPAQAGPYVKISYYFTRRGIGKLTGRENERWLKDVLIGQLLPPPTTGAGALTLTGPNDWRDGAARPDRACVSYDKQRCEQ